MRFYRTPGTSLEKERERKKKREREGGRERHIWTTRGHTLLFTENEMAFLLLFSSAIPLINYSLFPANDSIRVSETRKQTKKTPNVLNKDNRVVFSRGDLGIDVGVDSSSG